MADEPLPERKVEHLIRTADTASIEGRNADALKLYEEASAIARKHGLGKRESEALGKMATIEVRTGEMANAEAHFRRCMEIAKEMGDENGWAESVRGLGLVHLRKAEFYQAEECFQRYQEAARSLKDSAMLGRSSVEMGGLYLNLGRLGVARQAYLKAIEQLEPLGPNFELMRAFNNFAEVEKRDKRYRSAIKFLERALQICKETRSVGALIWPLINLAENYAHAGDIEKGEEMLAEAMPLIMRSKNNDALSNALWVRALLARKRKDFADAERDITQSLQLAKGIGRAGPIALVLIEFARLERDRGAGEKAVKYLKTARQLYRKDDRAFWVKDIDEMLKDLEKKHA